MKLLALLALVAFAAARHTSPSEWHSRALQDKTIGQDVYVSGEQYEYVYDGQLMSGIPQSDSQHSSTRIQAYVVFQFQDATNVKMHLKHVRMGSLNKQVLSPRMMQPFTRFDEAPIRAQHLDVLKAPLRFTYIDGMIDNIQLDAREETWSANIKRSLLNMLQVNLKKKRVVKSKYETREQSEEPRTEGVDKFDAFTTMEKSIEGECETLYTIVSLPPRHGRRLDEQIDILNTTRSINFEKCNRRPDIRYNFRFQTVCPTCEQRYDDNERVLRSSTIIRQNMTAQRDRSANLVESTIVEGLYTLVPFTDDGNVIQVYVNQTMVLVRTRPIESSADLQAPIKESDSDLIASLEEDVEKEKFLMYGDNGYVENSPYPAIPNKIRVVEGIMQKLLSNITESTGEQAPLHFSKLVKALRLFDAKAIKSTHEQFCGNQANMPREEASSACSLTLDAMALCGSKDCIDHIVKHIKSNAVTPLKATLLVRKLTQVHTVSKHMIEKIWSIPSNDRCDKSPMLCQSAYLAVGSMLNAVCAPNKDRRAITGECKYEDSQRWVQMLSGKYNNCKDDICKVTLLKAFANAGIDVSVYELEKIFKNRRQETPAVRVEAILALRLLAPQMPLKVQKVLMPIFMNKLETPFVRMAAFSKIMQTQPSKAIIDQLTIALHTEGNLQVSTFVFTSLQTLANSTQPCEKRMADDIRLSLRHARSLPISALLRNSKFVRAQGYSEYLNRGFQFDLNSIMSNQSMIPKELAASLHLETANIWTRYVGTVGFSQSNLDAYLRRVMRRSGHHLQTALLDVLSGESESEEKSADSSESDEYKPKFNYRSNLNKMFKDMEIASRESAFPESDKQLLANLYLRFFDQDYMFFPLTKETLPKYIREYLGRSGDDLSMESIVEKAGKYMKDMSIPFNLRSATLAFESQRKIYTVFGMPLMWSCKAPAVAQASGMIKFNFNDKDRLTKFDVQLKDFKPSFSLTVIDILETWSPVLNSGIKLVANAKLFAPFDGQLAVDMTKPQPLVKFTWAPKRRSYELVKVTTRPITTVLVWPAKLLAWAERQDNVIQGREWTRLHQIDTRFGRERLGTEVHAHGQWHYAPSRKVSTTPFCFLAGPNKLAVHVRPGDQQPQEYTVILSAKMFEYLENKQFSPKFADNFYTKSDEYLDISSESHSTSSKSSSAESNERDVHYKKYIKEYKTKGVVKNSMKLQLLTKGSTIERKVLVTGEQSCTTDRQSCLVKVDVDASPIPLQTSTNWKLTSQIMWLHGKPVYNVGQLIDSDTKSIVQFKATWGTQEQQKKQMFEGKIVGEQSDMQKELIKDSLYYQSYKNDETRNMHKSHFGPVAQYEQTIKYGLLDQYKMDLDYKVDGPIKNVTQKVFEYIKNYYYWQTEVDYQLPKSEKREQITARLNIDPINRRYVNVTVKSPTQRTRMYDLPVYTSLASPFNARRSSSSARTVYGLLNEYISARPYGQERESVCEIRSDRVLTFDGLHYNAPVSTCFSLVAKDCSSSDESRFGIYVKREEESDEKKVLKIVARHVQLLVRLGAGGKIECSLNKKDFQPCERIDEVYGDRRHSLLRVESYDEEYVKLYLAEQGVRVYFDGYAVNVKVSSYEEHMCGVCGNGNQQIDECELRTAQGECIDYERPSAVRDMYKSYMPSECEEEATAPELHYTRALAPWDVEDEYEVRGWGTCTFCKGIVGAAESAAKHCGNNCQQVVEKALEWACDKSPFFKGTCKKIADHADDVIQWLRQGDSTKTVCKKLHLC